MGNQVEGGKGIAEASPQKTATVSRQATTPRESFHPAVQLRHIVGNQAMQRLVRGGAVDLTPSQPDDSDGRAKDQGPHLRTSGLALQRAPQDGDALRGGSPEAAPGAPPAPGPAGPPLPAPSAAAGLIVDDRTDDADLTPLQMKRSVFLAQLRASLAATVDEAVASSPFAPLAQPEFNRQFGAYAAYDGPALERTLRAQIPGAGGVQRAADFIPLVCAQVRRSIANEDTSAPSTTSTISDVAQGIGDAISTVASVLFKSREGASHDLVDPPRVRNGLGGGRSLESGVRSGFESAYGHDFSSVRIHTDARAARLSDSLHARAFTVGKDVAFAAGEYRPGTVIGDALIAHELAHVVQQQGASSPPLSPGQQPAAESSELEADADRSALGAVASLWGQSRAVLNAAALNLVPSIRSGLRLQRCSKPEKTEIDPNQKAIGDRVQKKMEDINAAGVKLYYWPTYKQLADAHTPGYEWKDEYFTGYTTSPYWDKTGKFQWSLKKGQSASTGIQSWLQGVTIADCATAATAIQYDTIRAAVGNKKFDAYFSSGDKSYLQWLVIGQNPAEIPLSKFMEEPQPGDRVPGDWYYFRNHPDYLNKHPRGLWAGEHVIYMGQNDMVHQDLFQGFGSDQFSETQMLQKLLDNYNKDRTPEDLAKLDEIQKENNGVLPEKYVYTDKGGKLLEKLPDDPQAIVKAGGGLEATGGSRLSMAKINQVIK